MQWTSDYSSSKPAEIPLVLLWEEVPEQRWAESIETDLELPRQNQLNRCLNQCKDFRCVQRGFVGRELHFEYKNRRLEVR